LKKFRIGVLVSGGGTNLQAIIDAIESDILDGCEITTVVSSKSGVFALERAEKHGLHNVVISRKDFEDLSEFDSALCEHMLNFNVDLIITAGFLSVLGEKTLKNFNDKIINVHPSLIPSFCGKGYYGIRVHEAALERGVKLTGATVHIVNEIVDGGPILAQKAIDILPNDTAETLQQRVMIECEQVILVEAIRQISENY